MKKIFTIALAFVSVIAFAQQKPQPNSNNKIKISPRPARESEIRTSLELGSQQVGHSRGGSILFSEDFANGFAGNNTIGPWTHSDSGNDLIWMMATPASPAGNYSQVNEALNSSTKTNGWVIFDCDLFQGGPITADNPAVAVTGYLTSPAIDLTSTASVLLEYQHTFRYCCADSKPLVIEVSNDGGNTWTVFDAAPTFTSGSNIAPANPLTSVIDISAAAAGESSVIIRWGWQPNGADTHSHYYWGIDDIAIYENPVANDLRVNYVTTGDIFVDYEYSAIPLEQANPAFNGGMIVGTLYQNFGTNAQNATITAEILDANNVVLNSTSQTVTVPANIDITPIPGDQVDSVYISTNWVPTAVGTYSVRTTISYTGNIEETPLDNVMSKTFEVTSCEFGHDIPASINGRMEPISGTGTAADPFPPSGYGAYYTFPNAASTAYGMTIRFTNTTNTGCPITLVLYKRNLDFNLGDADYVTGAEYTVLNQWTPSGSQSYPYYLPFDDASILNPEETYFAGVQTTDDTVEELSVQAVVEEDADNSTGRWAETTQGTFVWFFGLGTLTDFSPAIRLVTCDYVGVEEAPAVGLNSFTVSPNPASDMAKIGFNLSGSRYIAYEVRDMSGRLVDWKNMGQFSPGQQSFSLDLTGYSSGLYSVNIVIDGVHLFTQQMSIVK
jgi:Secretion system C-terminal sorting domain